MVEAVALFHILGLSSVLKASCWGFLGLWQYFAISEFLSLLGCQESTMRMKIQLHEGEKRKGKGRMKECWTVRWTVFFLKAWRSVVTMRLEIKVFLYYLRLSGLVEKNDRQSGNLGLWGQCAVF